MALAQRGHCGDAGRARCEHGGWWAWPLAFAGARAGAVAAGAALADGAARRGARARRARAGRARRAAGPRAHGRLGRRRERLGLARLAGRACRSAAAAAAARRVRTTLAGERRARRPTSGSPAARARRRPAGVDAAGQHRLQRLRAAAAAICRCVNPLDIGVAVALLAVWLWRSSEAARPRAGARAGAADCLARRSRPSSGSTRCWCAASTISATCRSASTPGSDSLAVQTGITLLWTATALVLDVAVGAARAAAALDGRRRAAGRRGAQAAAGRPVGHRHRDAHRLLHRRRRADAGHRLCRAAAGRRRQRHAAAHGRHAAQRSLCGAATRRRRVPARPTSRPFATRHRSRVAHPPPSCSCRCPPRLWRAAPARA